MYAGIITLTTMGIVGVIIVIGLIINIMVVAHIDLTLLWIVLMMFVAMGYICYHCKKQVNESDGD